MFGEGLGSLVRPTAHEFPGDFKWLNTLEPLSLAKLRGQVVVLDFWTYCCINCMHMLPTLAKIENAYRDKPVVVIGVHSAKFGQEQKPENIEQAIRRYEMQHPVIVDQKMKVWHSYGVNAWPTIVVIGPDGKITYKKAGEVPFAELDGAVDLALDEHRDDGKLAPQPFAIKMPQYKDETLLSYPGKLALSDDESRLAVSDSNHNRILVIDTSMHRVIAQAGSGIRGLRDGSLKSAEFFRPQGVLWRGNDTIYVADTENHAIREVDLANDSVKLIAGTGQQGMHVPPDFTGNGAGTKLCSPWDLAFYNGKLLIAMAGLNQIWAYETNGGIIYPFAGSGIENIHDDTLLEAAFAQPSGVSVDKDFLYVADSEVSGVRSVDIRGKFVSTLVGSGLFKFGSKDGSLYTAQMQHPLGVFASEDTVYVADTYNSSIRAIDLKADAVRTLVGTPDSKSYCKFGDPGCDTLGLYEPGDAKLSKSRGMLYIADTNNHLIRTFDLKEMKLRTLDLKIPQKRHARKKDGANGKSIS